MRTIILKKSTNHIELSAYYTTNNFRDQLITFTHEQVNGEITRKYYTNPEGEHVFSPTKLKKLWEIIK